MVSTYMFAASESIGSVFQYHWSKPASFHDFPTYGSDKTIYKLDDGWPESVEEQGLLLLVWRDHITKQYIKDVL